MSFSDFCTAQCVCLFSRSCFYGEQRRSQALEAVTAATENPKSDLDNGMTRQGKKIRGTFWAIAIVQRSKVMFEKTRTVSQVICFFTSTSRTDDDVIRRTVKGVYADHQRTKGNGADLSKESMPRWP